MEQVLDESCLFFFSRDSTGKVLVNPQGAELTCIVTFTD